jgi:hypothetical protein
MDGGITLSRWSALLIEEIFQDREGEGRPVTTIDAGGAQLVRALARAGVAVDETQALDLFLAAFPPRWQMLRWFSGVDSPREALTAFLILCCVAASEATGSEANDYRERIREMMGWDAIAMDCAALPRLWESLERQLAAAPPERQLRRLTLPDPRFRSQIGHAIELTFPSRQDGRRLKHDLDEGALADTRHPVAVMRWVSARLGRFSPAFQRTFADFTEQWRAGARALTDHRFWSGWSVVVDAWRPLLSQEPFHIVCDEWGRHQVMTPDGDPIALGMIERAGPAALRQCLSSGSPVLLRELDWGEWAWAGQGRAAAREAKAALVRDKSHSASFLARLDRAPVTGAAGWSLTTSIDLLPGTSGRLSISDDDLIETRVSGAPRVDGGRLARPSFPLKLTTSGPVESVTLAGGLAESVELKRLGAQEWRLSLRTPLSGDLGIGLEASGDEVRRLVALRASAMAPDWDRDLPRRFVVDDDIIQEWYSTVGAETRPALFPGSSASATRPPCQALLDLVEYLAARPTPMSVGGLLELLQSLQGVGDSEKWPVMRSLLEGGLIDPLRVRGWRGGAILPRAPRAVVVPTETGPGLRLDGLLNEVFLSRLHGAVDRLGLSVTATDGLGEWSSRTFTVQGDREPLEALTFELTLRRDYLAPSLAGHARIGGEPNADGTNHSNRQEISLAELEPLKARGVRLVLCRREADDAPPVWLVEPGDGRSRYWTHRHLALLDACAITGIAPAVIKDGKLTLAMAGAYVPLQVARWLRLASGASAGPVGETYGYPVAPRLEPVLRELLGLLAISGRIAGTRSLQRGSGLAIARPWGVDVVPVWRWARDARRAVR